MTATVFTLSCNRLEEAERNLDNARNALLLEILYKARANKTVRGGEELLESEVGRSMLYQRGGVMVQLGIMSPERFEVMLSAETEVMEVSRQLFMVESEVWAEADGARVLDLKAIDWRMVYQQSVGAAHGLHDAQRRLGKIEEKAQQQPLTGELFLIVLAAVQKEAEAANEVCEKLGNFVNDHRAHPAAMLEIAPLSFWQNCAAEDWVKRVSDVREALELARFIGFNPGSESEKDALVNLQRKLVWAEL